MKQFSELGIEQKEQAWAGDHIKFKKLLKEKITILDYRIKPSAYPEKGNGLCLHLHIEMDKKKHVTWTGSVNLQGVMTEIGKAQLPIETTPIENNERYEFS